MLKNILIALGGAVGGALIVLIIHSMRMKAAKQKAAEELQAQKNYYDNLMKGTVVPVVHPTTQNTVQTTSTYNAPTATQTKQVPTN